MGSPCLTPTAELMSFHPLIASLDGLLYACNVQQRRLGELLLDGRDKGVSVDGVEGILEVERDMRTLLWSMSKSVPNSVHVVFLLCPGCPHRTGQAQKDSREAHLLMWGHDGGADYLMKR